MRDRAMTPRLPSQLREAPRDRAASRSRAAHAPSHTAAREQSRDRSREQSGLFMRMQKTPSKAL